jgi:hypothetical protein
VHNGEHDEVEHCQEVNGSRELNRVNPVESCGILRLEEPFGGLFYKLGSPLWLLESREGFQSEILHFVLIRAHSPFVSADLEHSVKVLRNPNKHSRRRILVSHPVDVEATPGPSTR